MRTHRTTTECNVPKLSSKSWKNIELLCATAKMGLADCYSKTDFLRPSLSFNKDEIRLSMASNLRYIIIAQIGIKHWLRFYRNDNPPLPDLWEYIAAKCQEIDNAGDLGLAIWANVESGKPNCKTFVEKLVNNWVRLRQGCNAVELAWIVQGLVRFLQSQPMTNEVTDVLKDAHGTLMSLYCHDSGLFARHDRKGLKEVISRHIACFADQVYPILALANYGQHFRNDQSLNAAVAVAEAICRLQGPNGQWWWHYNVKTGTVAEEYPVFSVHQDSMAPMALLATDKVAGTDHSAHIEKGLSWLMGCNELNEIMVVPPQGIIRRDIHRRELSKMYRLTRGVLAAAECHRAHSLAGKNLFGHAINGECRPYHLGWVLYAWSDYLPRN